jgi:predicted small lipoprotein YifL
MVGDFRSKDESGNIVNHPDELAQWNHDLGDRFEMGTVYTVIAGLLNVLAIFDAYGGPLVFPPDEKKKQPDDDKKQNTA